MIALPPPEILHSLLDYRPRTGRLIWRARPATSKVNKNFNARFAGKEAGTIESWGYRQIRINGQLLMAHRVIWKMMEGNEPPHQLDHMDGNPSNNRWRNLRLATMTENIWNRHPNRNNTSGFPCIYPMKTKREWAKKFRVTMHINRRRQLIGDFHTLEEAKAAYEAAFAKHRNISFKR